MSETETNSTVTPPSTATENKEKPKESFFDKLKAFFFLILYVFPALALRAIIVYQNVFGRVHTAKGIRRLISHHISAYSRHKSKKQNEQKAEKNNADSDDYYLLVFHQRYTVLPLFADS